MYQIVFFWPRVNLSCIKAQTLICIKKFKWKLVCVLSEIWVKIKSKVSVAVFKCCNQKWYDFWPWFYIVVSGMTFLFFSFNSDLLFPISILTFILFFSLDCYYPFLFGLLFPFSLWTFISLFSLDAYSWSNFGFLPFLFLFVAICNIGLLVFLRFWSSRT